MAEEESFFSKVANEILQAAEQLSNRIDDGIAALMNGEISNTAQQDAAAEKDSVGEEHYDDDDAMEQSPLQGIAESVVGNILSQQTGPQTPMQHFQAFRHAITWSEPFIIGIVVFQMLMFCLTIWASRRGRNLTPRVILMLTIGLIVRTSEYWNRIANRNWRKFATQNYFDQRGIFVLIMVCGPLLMDSLIMLILFLREAAQLLVQVKKAELQKKRKQQAQAVGNHASGSSSGRRSKKDQ